MARHFSNTLRARGSKECNQRQSHNSRSKRCMKPTNASRWSFIESDSGIQRSHSPEVPRATIITGDHGCRGSGMKRAPANDEPLKARVGATTGTCIIAMDDGSPMACSPALFRRVEVIFEGKRVPITSIIQCNQTTGRTPSRTCHVLGNHFELFK